MYRSGKGMLPSLQQNSCKKGRDEAFSGSKLATIELANLTKAGGDVMRELRVSGCHIPGRGDSRVLAEAWCSSFHQ